MSVKTKPYLEQLEEKVEAYERIFSYIEDILSDDKFLREWMQDSEKEITGLIRNALDDAINFRTPTKMPKGGDKEMKDTFVNGRYVNIKRKLENVYSVLKNRCADDLHKFNGAMDKEFGPK